MLLQMGISRYKTAMFSVTAIVILTVYVLLEQNEHLELTNLSGESLLNFKDKMKQSYPKIKEHDEQVQYIQDAAPSWPKRNNNYSTTSSSKTDEKNGNEEKRNIKNNQAGSVKEDRDYPDPSTSSGYSVNHVKQQGESKVQIEDTTHERGEKIVKDDVESSDITDQSKSNDKDITGQSIPNDNDITDQTVSNDSGVTDQSISDEEAIEERVQRVKTRNPASAKVAGNDIFHASDVEINYLLEHKRRIEHMKQVCNDTDLLEKRIYRGEPSKRMYISKTYNFIYCKVPKSGCTFWTQIFLILRNFSTADVFGLKRFQVHQYSALFAFPLKDPKRYTTPMILVSRDPYSRLYSAFIDKAFLGILPKLCNRIRNQAVSVCSHDVTFEEFLRYIINRAKDNKVLNRHWAPIFSLCEPCNVNQYRLLKQESFSKDVDFVLKELRIDPIKYKKITNALHDRRVEITVPGILDTVYKVHLRQTMLASCIGLSGVAKRLWTSFKIQGYIDERIDFPESQFSSEADFRNRTFLTQVILNTIKNNPLTSLKCKKQRQLALVSAYRTVSAETIEDIKAIYKPDFVLFGYDTGQPTM